MKQSLYRSGRSFVRPVFVAGMHLSGTSLTAATLANAGLCFTESAVSPDPTHSLGYFEDKDFVRINRAAIGELPVGSESEHPDWGLCPTHASRLKMSSPVRVKAAEFVAERYSGGVPWGCKDPRMTLFLDDWATIVPDAFFVLVYRAPWEVAHSAQCLGDELFLTNPELPLRAWSQYNKRLLDFSQRNRHRCLLVHADVVARRNQEVVEALLKRTGGVSHATSDRVEVSPGFLNRPSGSAVADVFAALYPSEMEEYQALQSSADMKQTAVAGEAELLSFSDTEVVISHYGDSPYLVESVSSAFDCGFSHDQIHVYDDGSTDTRSARALQALEQIGIVVHRLTHRGLAALRQEVVSQTKAEFVVFLDVDNRMLQGFVAAARERLRCCPRAVAAYGDRVEFGARQGDVCVGDFDVVRLLASNYIDTYALYRVAAIREVGGYDAALSIWEDWDFWLTCCAAGRSLEYLPMPAFEYRTHPNSKSQEARLPEVRMKLHRYITEKHAELLRVHAPEVMRVVTERFHSEREARIQASMDLPRLRGENTRLKIEFENARKVLQSIEDSWRWRAYRRIRSMCSSAIRPKEPTES